MAAGLLIFVLLAQILHHYRGELADVAALHGPGGLAGFYQVLGAPLEPRWDISVMRCGSSGRALTVRQRQPVGAGPASAITRRARSRLPLLRVVMQDRFGNRVAARDLLPAEYLGRVAPRCASSDPGSASTCKWRSRIRARATTGFEIDACMVGHERTVTCANDPGSR